MTYYAVGSTLLPDLDSMCEVSIVLLIFLRHLLINTKMLHMTPVFDFLINVKRGHVGLVCFCARITNDISVIPTVIISKVCHFVVVYTITIDRGLARITKLPF